MTMILFLAVGLLKAFFSGFNKVIVALSGGADSAAVLKLSADFLGRENVVAMTAINKHIFNYEIENSRKIASVLGVKWIPFKAELPDEFYTNNEERCYYCKSSILSYMENYRMIKNIDAVFDGTTTDDLNEKRPGFKALKNLNIISPFLKTGRGKAFVLEICRFFESKRICFNDESCVATRICNQNISDKLLNEIEKIEDGLRSDYKGIRVRFYPDNIKVEFKINMNLTMEDKSRIESEILKYNKELPIVFNTAGK